MNPTVTHKFYVDARVATKTGGAALARRLKRSGFAVTRYGKNKSWAYIQSMPSKRCGDTKKHLAKMKAIVGDTAKDVRRVMLVLGGRISRQHRTIRKCPVKR